ncbi:helix-turn-helix domain-containing protein, partial [Serratia plymuthica]|uniref:helix-turn-helix domain-containing protein n=1 Tax=Serratia plymuthica TaxID=82996 RepID=UPI001BB0684C
IIYLKIYKVMMSNSIENSYTFGSSISLVDNMIHCHIENNSARLSKHEVKLLQCLLLEKECKEEIINFIWGGNRFENIESKYKHLICRTRKKLMKAGFPSEIILTKPRSSLRPGVSLNKSLIRPAASKSRMCDLEMESMLMRTFQM